MQLTNDVDIDSSETPLDALRELAETLARGEVPTLAGDFTWRGHPCSRDELEFKLGALSAMEVTILDSRAVPHAPTMEIAPLIETFAGVAVRDSDTLSIVTAQFGQHLITWGLLVSDGALRAWFDPSQLLQMIAPSS